MSPIVAREDRQNTFFFVVPLAMEGRWRLLREGDEFDPRSTAVVEFDAGKAAITTFHWDEGQYTALQDEGAYCVEGGRLTVEFVDGGQFTRIVGAAPVDPDVLGVIRTRWIEEDDPADYESVRCTLIREDLATALHEAEAKWTGGQLSKVH